MLVANASVARVVRERLVSVERLEVGFRRMP
jgi:hypothetical protein